ncbi:MAG: IS91 family transposase [Saprospiraceae bacterium]|nr:IS91 family transposase [Saprospiraceae bacterium]
MKPAHEIGEILRGVNLDDFSLSGHQKRVLSALRDCRTAALGGHLDACDDCGQLQISYNSCRNRHCPKCQGVEKEEWLLGREQDLLPVTYFHVVFTLPHELNDLCRYAHAGSVLYGLLFESAKQTLQQFGRDSRWLGAEIGVTMVLHTWGQNLSLHPHVHCIVPNGGLKKDGTWQFPKKGNEKFLFPVKAMQSVYKALFMKGLQELIQNKALDLPPNFSLDKPVYKAWKNALYGKDWVIYAKRPFGGPKQVIEYLGRYTHKVAISNHRIQSVDTEGVTFEYKDYKTGGEKKTMRLTMAEFIRRFAQHILPPKFRRLRHYGFLSNASKGKSLAKARQSLGVKAQATLDKAARRAAARERLLGQNPNRFAVRVAKSGRCIGLAFCRRFARRQTMY